VKDLLFDMSGGAKLGVFRAGFGVNQAGLALLLISPLPLIEGLSGDAEVSAGIGYVLGLFSVIEYAKFSPDVVKLSWTHFLPPRLTLAFSATLSIEVVRFINQWSIYYCNNSFAANILNHNLPDA
jgi:hypothetical protein